MIEPEEEPLEPPQPNIAAIAIIGFMTGLILWFGGACLVLGNGGADGSPRPGPAGNISTPLPPRPTATTLADRTSCGEIRGTEYRSEAERQWFRQKCT